MLRCLAAVPPRQGRESWREVLITFRLLDREGTCVASGTPALSPENIQELAPVSAPGRATLLVAQDFKGLKADRYTLDVELGTTGGRELARTTAYAYAKSFDGGLRLSGLEPFVEDSPRWKDIVWGGRQYLPALPVVQRGGRLSFFYVIYGLTPRAGIVEYEPSLILARLEDLRNDLRSASTERKDGDAVRYGELDQVLPRLTLDTGKYRAIRYQPTRVDHVRRSRGAHTGNGPCGRKRVPFRAIRSDRAGEGSICPGREVGRLYGHPIPGRRGRRAGSHPFTASEGVDRTHRACLAGIRERGRNPKASGRVLASPRRIVPGAVRIASLGVARWTCTARSNVNAQCRRHGRSHCPCQTPIRWNVRRRPSFAIVWMPGMRAGRLARPRETRESTTPHVKIRRGGQSGNREVPEREVGNALVRVGQRILSGP